MSALASAIGPISQTGLERLTKCAKTFLHESVDARNLDDLLTQIRHGRFTGALTINFRQGSPAGMAEFRRETTPTKQP